jgi:hypothetical protein
VALAGTGRELLNHPRVLEAYLGAAEIRSQETEDSSASVSRVTHQAPII